MVDVVDTIAGELCEQFVRRVANYGDSRYIVSTFKYADGDFINIYVDEIGDSIQLSDYGTTFHKLNVAGVSVGARRQEMLDSICKTCAISLVDGVVSYRVSKDAVHTERAMMRFVEGIIRISNMEFLESGRNRSFTKEKVDHLLARAVEPHRHVLRHWHDSDLDPAGDFKVDFHLNSVGTPRNIFVVASNERASAVGLSAAFYRERGVAGKAMVVVDPLAKSVTGRAYRRLSEFVDEICPGVDGQESRIVEFALSE